MHPVVGDVDQFAFRDAERNHQFVLSVDSSADHVTAANVVLVALLLDNSVKYLLYFTRLLYRYELLFRLPPPGRGRWPNAPAKRCVGAGIPRPNAGRRGQSRRPAPSP